MAAQHHPPAPPGAKLPPSRPSYGAVERYLLEFAAFRKEGPLWQYLLLSASCVALCFVVWWFLTSGEAESRLISPVTLPSPAETFASFPSLWFDESLSLNTLVTLKRVLFGFGLATLVGVPLGVLCGCFSRVNAFFLPLTIFGRNVPVAALIPLLFLFGMGELEKTIFLFIACVAFVVVDTARAVNDVSVTYLDTAYTLGANRWQVMTKVMIPLAMPSICNSLRLLFGLAFGYIMLAELVVIPGRLGGLGAIINVSQSRGGKREYILLLLLIIPLVALLIDRVLFWMQKQLFPHQYGGSGLLNRGVRALLHGWEDLLGRFRHQATRPETKTLPE